MITFKQGDIFQEDVEAVVNTVNTVGAMGKGLALAFKNKFPENNKHYADACRNNHVVTGKMFVVSLINRGKLRYIVNFPTKQHWRNPSQIEWIADGLKDLRQFILSSGISSIAIPALGVGLGGLQWSSVKELIRAELEDLNHVEIIVFEPH